MAVLKVDADVAQRLVADQAALQAILEAFLGQVGVDRRGADADQHREIVGVQALGRADDDRDVRAQALGDQVGVDAAGGQDHRQGDAVGLAALVGQDDVRRSRAAPRPRPRRRMRSRLARRASPGRASGTGSGMVQSMTVDALLAQQAVDALVHAGGQDRAFQHVDVGLGRVLRRGCCPGSRTGSSALITPVSRRLSIGGLVTWLKLWRKKWCSPRYCSLTARPAACRRPSSPRPLWPRRPLDAKMSSKSSWLQPTASWRRPQLLFGEGGRPSPHDRG